MTREQYNAIQAIHYSVAKYLLKTPLHYQQALKDEEDGAEDEKFAVGTLAHAMVLENKDLSKLFAIKPRGMSFATTKGKEWKAEQTLPILKEEDLNKVPRMAEAIVNHPRASRILRGCTEREYCLQATMGGLPCKALLDGVGSDDDAKRGILEIKTTRDASPWTFAKLAYDLHYDLQATFYSHMLALVEKLDDRPWMTWVAVENSPPWAVACYSPSEFMIESGMQKLSRVFEALNQCMESGHWVGYSEEIIEINPPGYRIRELTEMMAA